jgi:2-hydroxy-3-keto-5-methylthiopentenyl-1-phosphate phosphatase
MVQVFCDFDGTISIQDIGNVLFRTYAGEQALSMVQSYLRGEITAPGYYRAQCAAVKSLTREELLSLVNQCEIDPWFRDFTTFCREQEIPVTVLGDGFDAYVEPFLRKHGVGHLSVLANHLEFEKRDGETIIVPSFPYSDAECPRCANCKRNHMVNRSADEDVLVYIGNGYSDYCPVRYADVVFAKGQLIAFCQQNNITYHAFTTFADVSVKFRKLLRLNRMKPRREALQARRALFLQG